MNENWHPVSGYDGLYEVSDLGRVRSLLSDGCVLRPTLRNGYPCVQLWSNGRGRTEYVHRLTASAFCPNDQAFRVVRHLDGDKLNNVPANLAWGTHSENSIDAVTHGANRLANQTHCKRGHEFTPENTITKMRKGRPNRNCRTCTYASNRRSERAA